MTIQVSFALRAWSGEEKRLLGEDQLTASGPALEAAIADSDDNGFVTIQRAGVPDFSVSDDLQSLVTGLCLQGIRELARGRAYELHHHTYFGSLKLVPENQEIRLLQDGVEQARYPAAELLPALVDCGERYVDFLQRLHGDKEGMQAYYDELRGKAGSARAAIAG